MKVSDFISDLPKSTQGGAKYAQFRYHKTAKLRYPKFAEFCTQRFSTMAKLMEVSDFLSDLPKSTQGWPNMPNFGIIIPQNLGISDFAEILYTDVFDHGQTHRSIRFFIRPT